MNFGDGTPNCCCPRNAFRAARAPAVGRLPPNRGNCSTPTGQRPALMPTPVMAAAVCRPCSAGTFAGNNDGFIGLCAEYSPFFGAAYRNRLGA